MIALFILITLLLLALFLLATAYGYKNVTMTIEKGEMVYCYYGNKEKATAVCNSLEIKNNPHLIDQFLQFLETGVIEK